MTSFTRADSRNLPEMDTATIVEYLSTSDKHNVAEIRGAKALKASRDGYLESAVGYVQVKRENTEYIVKAKVVPEHKVTKKYYLVTVHINEKESSVIDTLCDGCPALAGGCKHTLVVLYWLEKKASEPSPTAVECYWAKPRLASEGTQPVLSKDIFKSKRNTTTELGPRDPEKLEILYEECKKRKLDNNSLILTFLAGPDTLSKLCMFDLVLEFTIKSLNTTYENFKSTMSTILNTNVIKDIVKCTTNQAEAKFWHSIRQGRITGSEVYEAGHCSTSDGSLVQQILGGYKVYETKAMKRGKKLEKHVVREIERKLRLQIKETGFHLINLISGASPDGVASDFIIEVKCPSTVKTVSTYLNGNIIRENFYAQCQFEMLATRYKKCAFCVADPNFETNKKIQIIWVEFDSTYANNLLIKSEEFWKHNIYPKILGSAVLI